MHISNKSLILIKHVQRPHFQRAERQALQDCDKPNLPATEKDWRLRGQSRVGRQPIPQSAHWLCILPIHRNPTRSASAKTWGRSSSKSSTSTTRSSKTRKNKMQTASSKSTPKEGVQTPLPTTTSCSTGRTSNPSSTSSPKFTKPPKPANPKASISAKPHLNSSLKSLVTSTSTDPTPNFSKNCLDATPSSLNSTQTHTPSTPKIGATKSLEAR